MTCARTVLACCALLPLLVAAASADEPRWKQHAINAQNEFEAAGVFDVDNDGKLDIVAGATWYQAPDWKPFPVRDVKRVGTYFNDFSTFPLDLNGDGYTDFITCSYFGRRRLGREPRQSRLTLDLSRSRRAGAHRGCLDGRPLRGRCARLPAQHGERGRLVRSRRRSDGKGFELKKHDLGVPAAGHGVGSGDLNGDGRTDLLTPKGWFEAPADPAHDTWSWHPDWQVGATGIQMLARDVDGDGLSDVVYGMGHDYGLFWLRQDKGPAGERTWTKQTIDNSVASVHALIWADIDGDGKAHELVTGKRVYAHEVEPGATDGSLVAWYDFNPNAKSWVKHVIFQGEPAKRPRRSARSPGAQGLPTRNGRNRSPAHRHRHRSRRRPRPRLPRQERALSLREPACSASEVSRPSDERRPLA